MSEINISLLEENQNFSKFVIAENFNCIRFLDHNKEKFELEFNLEKGTSLNTFLIKNNEELLIIHPPEKQYLNSFNEIISNFFNQYKLKKINVISGHINPKIIETIKNVNRQFKDLTITCSNPGFKLISDCLLYTSPSPRDVP